MNQFLKNIGSTLLAIVIFISLLLLGAFFIKGSLWFSETLFPWGFLIFSTTVIADIVLFLPLSFFRKTREIGLIGLFISSYLFGLLLWTWSFLIVYVIWGWLAIIIGLIILGVGVVPIAIIALLLNPHGLALLQLSILIILTFGIRFIVIYLGNKTEVNYEE